MILSLVKGEVEESMGNEVMPSVIEWVEFDSIINQKED